MTLLQLSEQSLELQSWAAKQPCGGVHDFSWLLFSLFVGKRTGMLHSTVMGESCTGGMLGWVGVI